MDYYQENSTVTPQTEVQPLPVITTPDSYSTAVNDWNSTLLQVTLDYVNTSFTGVTVSEAVTITKSTFLSSDISASLPPVKCVKEELSEPDFPRYACEGSKITSWIASVYLLSMIVFGVIKCLTAHGPRNIFDIRREGVSFPQRPEFFVLICSTLPLIFTVITRPLFTPLPLNYDIFIRGWGLAQTRFFFDLFTRTASIYHLVYWAYRTPIIHLLWRIHLLTQRIWTKWKNRPKPVQQIKLSVSRTSIATINRTKQPARRRGRTTDYGYGKRRHRTRSVRSDRSDGKSANPAPHSMSDQMTTQAAQVDNPPLSPTQTPVISAAGLNLISPQPLFSNYAAGNGMWLGSDSMHAPFAQNMMRYTDGSSMYSPMAHTQSQSAGYGGMYGMPLGMGMGQTNFVTQNYLPQSPLPTTGQHLVPGTPASETVTNDAFNESTLKQDHKTKLKKDMKVAVELPPPTRAFSSMCKRIIPGCIYITSFFITIPSVLSFEVDPQETAFVVARCTPACRSYFYYDLVALITIPTIMIIVAFYHGALSTKQLNGGTKMAYRLRCYYVTFILLNIPMFVLMLTSIGFRLSAKPYKDIYGTGILIAMTAYHSNFALKPTIYTTGCNCICCSDACFRRFPLLDKFVTFFTTPVYVKDREAGWEGTSLLSEPQKSAEKSMR